MYLDLDFRATGSYNCHITQFKKKIVQKQNCFALINYFIDL